MLTSIEFRNYRCFEQHIIPIKAETIVVGRNNAGKSTLIEGLRFAGLVTERYRNLNFSAVPGWLEISRLQRGVRPSLEGFDISLENVFHRYGDPPAAITARFHSGEVLTVYLGPNGASHTTLQDSTGRYITTKGAARTVDLPTIAVLPQVAPLAKDERILGEDYVRRSMSSTLAPSHFRNQLKLLHSTHFADFCQLVESTWPGVRVIELRGRTGGPGDTLSLMVQDGDFVAEAAWMGHGLQMWLQTMWFITRTTAASSIILDEPDVYMHPDLQRALVKFIRGRFRQTIIATHSTEILAEVEPANILVLNRQSARSGFATSLPAVQRVLESIGSVQNLSLTRLWSARRVLLVEGKDIGLLKRLHTTLYQRSELSLDALPNMPIGGWSGWPYAVGTSMILRNAGDQDITVFCVLDKDYHTPDEIAARRADAVARRVQLHIWRRKEIENYLLIPAAIQRLIADRAPARVTAPSVNEVTATVNETTANMQDLVLDNLANEILIRERCALQHANQRARQIVLQAWADPATRLELVPGKEMISRLSDWAQRNFGVSLNAGAIASSMRAEEIPEEMRSVLSAIEANVPFVDFGL